MDPADNTDVGSPGEREEADLLGSPKEQKSEKEPQKEQEEDDMGLDISTEFETGEEQLSITTRNNTHPCILELRLISSNIQNFKSSAKLFVSAPCFRSIQECGPHEIHLAEL